MQRKPLILIFLKGLFYAVFGNLLSGIMTIALAPFISEWFIPYIAILFTVFIYGSLIFTAGYRDGEREKSMLKNKRVESSPKYRWIIFGLIIGAVYCIPNIVMLLGITEAITITGEYLFAFRFICGSIYPLMHILGIHNVPANEMPIYFPIICMAIYAVVTPITAQIGYKFGFDEKSAKSFMYEEK